MINDSDAQTALDFVKDQRDRLYRQKRKVEREAIWAVYLTAGIFFAWGWVVAQRWPL
jgi:hypothetical protein